MQMPLADLRNIYDGLRRKRVLFTTIPIFLAIASLFIYGVVGYISYYLFMMTQGQGGFKVSVVGALDIVAMMFCCFILIAYHGKPANNIALWLLTSYMLITLLFNTEVSVMILLTYIFLVAVRLPMAQIDEDIDFLRSMPTFPFNERVSSHMIEVAEHKRKIQLIESAKGNIYSDDAEQIFDMPIPEPPKYEKGDTPEDYFQRKKTYLDGKMIVSSLSDEEFDRQEDELYSHHIYRDKRKKAEGLPIVPQEIEDDGHLQDFDYTEFDPPKDDNIIVSDEVFIEEFDFTDYNGQQS